MTIKPYTKNINLLIEHSKKSRHFQQDRLSRYRKILSLEKFPVINESFLVDNGHKKGMEIHCVSTHGIIYIYNYNSRKLITMIIARPNQIKRLYESCGENIPEIILQEAKKNNTKKCRQGG